MTGHAPANLRAIAVTALLLAAASAALSQSFVTTSVADFWSGNIWG